jgi:elongation factor Ts
MAEISAKLVQELRKQTNAGMMDCKKALAETGGDLQEAADWLRKKGMVAAGKKEARVAAEGLVEGAINANASSGALLEVNCQTDFVARNENFKSLVEKLTAQALSVDTLEELLAAPYAEDNSINVGEAVKQAVAKIGENIQVRRLAKYSLATGTSGLVECYIHTGGRVGVILELNTAGGDTGNDEFKGLARSLAMQVAACPNVEYIDVASIPEEISAREKSLEMGRDDLANKPDNIKEKIVQGRIDKRLKEMTLVDQPYIRDQNMTVSELVDGMGKTLGGKITVTRFSRFILGDGIEKEESDFAAEVAAQMAAMQ